MANRNWASGGKIYSMHVMPVFIDCVIAIGASGAVSSFTGSGITSVTRTGTGLYKIKGMSQTNFSKMFFASGSACSPVSGLSGVLGVEIQNDPNTSAAIADGFEMTIKTLDAAGALVNPASGSAITAFMVFSNSSVTIP